MFNLKWYVICFSHVEEFGICMKTYLFSCSPHIKNHYVDIIQLTLDGVLEDCQGYEPEGKPHESISDIFSILYLVPYLQEIS